MSRSRMCIQTIAATLLVSHTSPKTECGEPQTPQEDVATERQDDDTADAVTSEKGLVSMYR